MDFTEIFNKGIRRYIDKNIKKRFFGKCEGCSKPAILITYTDPIDKKATWDLCEFCYTDFLNSENED